MGGRRVARSHQLAGGGIPGAADGEALSPASGRGGSLPRAVDPVVCGNSATSWRSVNNTRHQSGDRRDPAVNGWFIPTGNPPCDNQGPAAKAIPRSAIRSRSRRVSRLTVLRLSPVRAAILVASRSSAKQRTKLRNLASVILARETYRFLRDFGISQHARPPGAGLDGTGTLLDPATNRTSRAGSARRLRKT